MKNADKICSILLIMFLLSLASLKSLAMPPHPDLEKKMILGEVPVPEHLLNPRFMQEKGIDQPSLHPASEVYPTGTGPVGSFKALVLLVDFSDNPSSVNGSFFDTLILENQQGCVHHYYQEVSYGALDIITVNLPSATGWKTAPETYVYYVNGLHGMGAYPQNSQKLVEDLVALADPVVDFSDYDNDSDGYVDALIVVHTGPGAELTQNPNDIWSHKWSVPWPWTAADGVKVRDYTIQPEYWYSPYDMTCGVYCHELGHVFGLPDLYDTDYSSYGIGQWSLMAGGSWNGYLGDSPAHPDAWCMTKLGYVSATVVASNTSDVEIPAIENSPVAYKLWTSGSPLNEYFLVVNRQKTGYDSALPHHGLLIWHVDESIGDYGANDDEWYPGHTSYGHYKVALEQSDGLWELESTIPFGYVNYSNDPYPRSLNQRTFNGSSAPNSQSYAETETYVAVANISNSGDTITCDLFVSPADVEEEFTERSPSDYVLKQNYPNPFNPTTEIGYFVPRDGHIKLEIFNVLGQKIQTLVDQEQKRGAYTITWDGTNEQRTSVSNGIYFYQLSADDFEKTNKMILLK
ncbi:MAG: M6 family metalloprotease domain-containing protein [candidate division Zixibacteria bacterium]|nr:M6 family metalloprotease domain-containing protein [candidate division Zixibacteria bacterium]